MYSGRTLVRTDSRCVPSPVEIDCVRSARWVCPWVGLVELSGAGWKPFLSSWKPCGLGARNPERVSMC